jgi:hypothetical protein
MDYREFLNPQTQQLDGFLLGLCQRLQVDFEAVPHGRLFEQSAGAYLDPFSRIALGWRHNRPGQLIVRVRWL